MVTVPGMSPGNGAVLLSGLLEGAGIPWPGAVILAAIGADSGGPGAPLLAGTWFAITYTSGSFLQYLFGRYCRGLLGYVLSPTQQSKLDRIVQRYGQTAVLWTRPLAVGNYVSIPAGLMRMNPFKFLLFTFLGIWPWAATMALAGTYLASQIPLIERLLPYVVLFLVVAGLWPVLRRMFARAHKKRNRSKAQDEETALTA